MELPGKQKPLHFEVAFFIIKKKNPDVSLNVN